MNKKTRFHKLIGWVLTLNIFLTFIPGFAFGVSGAEELTDSITAVTLQDSDENNYYEIGNSDELLAFANLVNDGNDSINVELTNNIDMNGKEWHMIAYSGTIDGKDYTISNLEFTATEVDGEQFAGLIYANDATIKNITFENCKSEITSEISSQRDIYAAIIAPVAIGGVFENCSVIDCEVIQNGCASGFSYLGSLAGLTAYGLKIADCSIENCIVTDNSESQDGSFSAGLAGGFWADESIYDFGVSVKNTYIDAVVTANNSPGVDAASGLICSILDDSLAITEEYDNCTVTGTITAEDVAAGLIGDCCGYDMIINNCSVFCDSINAPYGDPFVYGEWAQKGEHDHYTMTYSNLKISEDTDFVCNQATSLPDKHYLSDLYVDSLWDTEIVSYADFVPELTTYSVTFDANNGTEETHNETIAEGSKYTLTDDLFTYDKCELISWNTEADGSGYVYYIDEEITVTEDITLYAQWELPLYKYEGFTDGDIEWSGNTSSPYTLNLKNGAVIYAGVSFPATTNSDKTTITADGHSEIKGTISFVSDGGYKGDLTINGNGSLEFYELRATGAGDTLTVEADVTVKNGLNIGASGGLDSKLVIKDSTLTLNESLILLNYLTMEGSAKLNITFGIASFHSNPEISLDNNAEIYIGGNGFECVLHKENGLNDAFDALVADEWLPEGFSFAEDGYYSLYDAEGLLELDAITIKKKGHTVIFLDWDGTKLNTQSVSEGAAAIAPPNPSREGYNFIGWDIAFGNVTSDLTITAQYEKKTVSRPSGGGGVSRYTVKFETNGGSEIKNQTVTRNSTIKKPDEPAKEGFSFEGWYIDKELTTAYDFETKVTKSFTLYAKWDEVETEEGDDGHSGANGHNCPSLKFSDLDITQWYHLDTDYVIGKNIFKGTTETTFTPDGNITRAMMITVLYRAEGEPEVTGKATFEDIDEKAYYAKAVVWGQQNGIIKGYSEAEYAPEQDILREQIAAIMHRYARFKGIDVSVGENTNILSYEDFEEVSEYAIPSMQWAVGSGMIKGRTETTLNPKAFATRVEIAAMLHRFIEGNK